MQVWKPEDYAFLVERLEKTLPYSHHMRRFHVSISFVLTLFTMILFPDWAIDYCQGKYDLCGEMLASSPGLCPDFISQPWRKHFLHVNEAGEMLNFGRLYCLKSEIKSISMHDDKQEYTLCCCFHSNRNLEY